MTATRVAIIVLILLAVLFVAMLAYGGRARKDSVDPSKSKLADTLASWLGDGTTLTASDIESLNPKQCGTRSGFNVQTFCAAVIRESSDAVRTARLALRSGNLVELTLYEAGAETSKPLKVKLNADNRTIKLPIRSKGGTLRMVCAGGVSIPCVVELEQSH